MSQPGLLPPPGISDGKILGRTARIETGPPEIEVEPAAALIEDMAHGMTPTVVEIDPEMLQRDRGIASPTTDVYTVLFVMTEATAPLAEVAVVQPLEDETGIGTVAPLVTETETAVTGPVPDPAIESMSDAAMIPVAIGAETKNEIAMIYEPVAVATLVLLPVGAHVLATVAAINDLAPGPQ